MVFLCWMNKKKKKPAKLAPLLLPQTVLNHLVHLHFSFALDFSVQGKLCFFFCKMTITAILILCICFER